MKQGTAELLLLTVIVSRSISYLLSKIGLHGVPPLELLAIRFFLTTIILLIIFISGCQISHRPSSKPPDY